MTRRCRHPDVGESTPRRWLLDISVTPSPSPRTTAHAVDTPHVPDAQVAPEITVYWRPGCPFCADLFRQLDRAGVGHQRVNIWEDRDAAAVVRQHADGNETVPTVVVGEVGLVNPTVHQILAAAA